MQKCCNMIFPLLPLPCYHVLLPECQRPPPPPRNDCDKHKSDRPECSQTRQLVLPLSHPASITHHSISASPQPGPLHFLWSACFCNLRSLSSTSLLCCGFWIVWLILRQSLRRHFSICTTGSVFGHFATFSCSIAPSLGAL